MPELTRPIKPLRSLTKKVKEEKSTYFYPKTNLYTRQEFELLDTIYSDEPPSTFESKDSTLEENFWPQNKEQVFYFNPNNNLFRNILWFTCGVILTSVIWFVFFQVKVHEIRTKDNTRIVFHKTAEIMTDKTLDKEVTKKLQNQKDTEVQKPKSTENQKQEKPWSSWFIKSKKEVVVNPASLPPVRFHTVGNGDSLWVIANKYYSNPSPENISKIAKGNKLKITAILQAGQKLVIPE